MATNGIIIRWLGGVASDTGLRYTAASAIDNRLLVVSPTLAYVVKYGSPPTIHACWLAASRHARHISAVRNAHPRHGGAGALYIMLKS